MHLIKYVGNSYLHAEGEPSIPQKHDGWVMTRHQLQSEGAQKMVPDCK